MSDPFDDPGTATNINWADLKGRLLLIYPHKLEEKIPTQDYGDKEAIRADMHVIDADGGPEVMRQCLIFPLVLQGQIRENIGTGRANLGRLGGGSTDRNATKEEKAWRLAPANDVDKQKARDYLNRKPVDKFDDPPF